MSEEAVACTEVRMVVDEFVGTVAVVAFVSMEHVVGGSKAAAPESKRFEALRWICVT